jgi:hypothetical protein
VENGIVPPNLAGEEHQSDSEEEVPAVRTHSAAIEPAATEGSQPMAREPSLTQPGQRRNTGGRKHSPSNPTSDHSALANAISTHTKESFPQLEEKFSSLQKDMADIGAQILKDAEEFKSQNRDLVKERDDHRKALREKEEASEKLRKEVNHSERANRQAQTRKQQKEKVLREKQNERVKMQTDVARWRNEIEQMKAEREVWRKEKEDLLMAKHSRAEELRDHIRKRQNSLHGLDQEVNLKGKQLLELEEERKKLEGDQEDDESRSTDAAIKVSDEEWKVRELDLGQQLNNHVIHLRQLEIQLHSAQITYNTISTRLANNPIMYHGNSSGVDFDPTSQGKAKNRRSRHHRKSVRNGTVSSPGYATTSDPPFPSTLAFNNSTSVISPTFFPGPYIDLNNDTAMVPLSENMANMSESEIRSLTAGAPLSPGATSLLPSTLFSDDDPPSPRFPFVPPIHGAIGQPALDNDPQSPSSSSRSASLLSSPRNSSHNLAMYGVASHDHVSDRERKPARSPREAFDSIGGSNPADSSSVQKLSSFFTFPKSRAKTDSQQSPALGSLKSGQSQSFPRSTDDPDGSGSRHRRVSFSSGWNVFRGPTVNDAAEGNAPAPARNSTARRRRPFNMFGSSVDDPTTFSDRDPSSPRPVSIASSDLPRPSTDSAPFGWPAAEGNVINRNSPLATNWSHTVTATWSRNPSRRPSVQHGSASLFVSGIASDDDEFLPSESMLGQTSPAAVGVIGTRPASSHRQVTPKLNPAAPTFKAMFNLSSNKDKDKDRSKGKERSVDNTTSDVVLSPASSPSESRKSRDAHSIHTQNSVAESTESLDRISSNTTSDANPSGATGKDKESSFTRLLRKGSSSKFSLSSIRSEKAGLFGSKKGVNSAANSDRDGSMDLGDETPFGKSVDSITSSPMLGGMASGEWNRKDANPATSKEGRMSVNWGRAFGIKKGKGRESLDVDRSETETAGTEDEDN